MTRIVAPADFGGPEQLTITEVPTPEPGPGEVRVAVNCAGVATPGRVIGRQGPLALDTFRTVVDINLVGSFNVMRLAPAAMLANEPLHGDLVGSDQRRRGTRPRAARLAGDAERREARVVWRLEVEPPGGNEIRRGCP